MEWAFVGGQIALGLKGMSTSALTIGYNLFYWAQILVVFFFHLILTMRIVDEHILIVNSRWILNRILNRVPLISLQSYNIIIKLFLISIKNVVSSQMNSFF